MASVVTIIITTIIGLFLFENVLLNESEKRRKLMLNAILRMNKDIKAKYKIKLQRAIFKIRTATIILEKYLNSLRGKFNFSETLIILK